MRTPIETYLALGELAGKARAENNAARLHIAFTACMNNALLESDYGMRSAFAAYNAAYQAHENAPVLTR